MANRPVSLPQILASFGAVCSQRTVGRLNDYDLRVAHAKAEHCWQSHDHTDEFFHVIAGRFARAARPGWNRARRRAQCRRHLRDPQRRPAHQGWILDHTDTTTGHELR